MDRHDRAVIDLGNIRDYIEHVVRERDEALARLREAQEAHQVSRVETEHLRAALELPDVGPVRRDAQGQSIWVGGQQVFDDRTTPEHLRALASRQLAIAAFLEAEALEAAMPAPVVLPTTPGSVIRDRDGDIYFQSGQGNDTWRDVNGDWVSSNWIETSTGLTVLFDAGAQKSFGD